MSIVICSHCNKIINYMDSEKVEKIYTACDSCKESSKQGLKRA